MPRAPFLISISLFVLLFSVPVHGALTDRTPLAESRSTLPDAGPGRVVASDTGLFLVHGQRISSDGVRIDQEPVPGTEGYAVAWPGGWLILRASGALFLGPEGPPEPQPQFAFSGRILGAASNTGRLAILELAEGAQPSWVYLSVFDESGLVQRRPLAALDGGAIAAFGDGFLAITHVRTSEEASVLHAWRIDADGTPTAFEDLGVVGRWLQSIEIAAAGDRALVVTHHYREISSRVIDGALQSSVPHLISGEFFNSAFPLALEEGFLLSYQPGAGGHSPDARAVLFDTEGNVEDEVAADPIVGGDRIGQRYLVVRPWGHAGLAEGDPRRIIAALPLKQRLYQPAGIRETAVSGEITLVGIGHFSTESDWIRFDADGRPIDSEPLRLTPRVAIALPEGFAFLTIQGGGITIRRLSREGGWIDPEPVLLASIPGLRTFAAHANDRDLMVAWTTEQELVWSTFAHDGTALQAEPFRLERRQNVFTSIHLAGNRLERLLLVRHLPQCNILCPPVAGQFGAMALTADAEPVGELYTLDVSTMGVKAVHLPDGTWVVPSGTNDDQLLHLAADASLLEEARNPMLRDIRDVEPTPAGWRATAGGPSRMVEINGFNSPVRVTGLGDVSTPHFGFGRWLAFAAESPGPEDTTIPWNGRLSTTEGDLSIEVRETRRDSSGLHLLVAVRNEGTRVATNVRITSTSHTVSFPSAPRTVREIPVIAPGEIVYLAALERGQIPAPLFFALSDDIEDINPSDNVASVSPPEPPQLRRRGVGR